MTATKKLIAVTELSVMPGEQHAVSPTSVTDLAKSIEAVGQLHPVYVRPAETSGYEIISGRRRFLACQLLGQDVECLILKNIDDKEALALRVAENDQRVDPNAYDTAVAIRTMKNTHGLSHQAVADALSMSKTSVTEYLSVFSGSDLLIETARTKGLSLAVLTELVRIEKQLGEVAGRKHIAIAAKGEVSVRQLRAIKQKKAAPTPSGSNRFLPSLHRFEKRLSAKLKTNPEHTEEVAAMARRILDACAATRTPQLVEVAS